MRSMRTTDRNGFWRMLRYERREAFDTHCAKRRLCFASGVGAGSCGGEQVTTETRRPGT